MNKKVSVESSSTRHIFPKGKKAMILVLLTSILKMLNIMPMLFFRMDSKKAQFEKTIGEEQIVLLQKYQTAQKDLFYIDQSAKYSAYDSIIELANNGGYSILGSKCGKYLGYNIWQKDCYPNYENNFNAFFKTEYTNYLEKANIKSVDYNIRLKDAMIGIAKQPLTYKFKNGNYSILPSFRIDIGYDIDIYKRFILESENLIKKCKDQACIEENLPKDWNLGDCTGNKETDGKHFRFCVKNGKFPIFQDGKISDQEVEYKFTLIVE